MSNIEQFLAIVLNTFRFINALIWVTFALLSLKQQGLFSVITYGDKVAKGRGDFSNLRRLAHSLESVAAILEAKALTEAASSIELAFRRDGSTA
jgi:hypothetical protein